MAQQTINPGSAPILWSSIDNAFDKINSNFTELYLTIAGGSSGAVDLQNLASTLSPNTSGAFFLGSSDNRWKALYLTADGIDMGGAIIFSPDGSAVNLPEGSTVGGTLIKDPTEASFKNIAVSGQSTVTADSRTDTVTLVGTDINITTNASTDTITFVNNGVTQLNGTVNEVGVSGTGKGNVTLTNLGVTQLIGTAGQIGVSGTLTGGRGQVTLTNLGVTSLAAGTGISISPAGGTGAVTITNDLPDTFGFRTIAVTGQSSIVAEIREDTLTITPGTNISITTVPGTDTMTISSSTAFDLKGSVFGDDSSILVDAVSNYIYGNVSATTLRTSESKIALGNGANSDGLQGTESIAIGYTAGGFTQGNFAVAIGSGAGNVSQGNNAVAIGTNTGSNQGAASIAIGDGAGYNTQGSNSIALGYNSAATTQGAGSIALGYTAAQITQGTSAVAIGWSAGQTNQGAYSIAIGYRAGFTNQNAGSIILNGSGAALNSTAAGLYINPVRSTTSAARPLVYDSATSEIFYTSTLEFINNRISTTDSSGLVIDVQTTFNTDAVFENDITVAERLTVKGSRVINLTELKSVVAASSSFADFQTRIAAIV
jgi:Head domain of trimeric autotransporter adhesin